MNPPLSSPNSPTLPRSNAPTSFAHRLLPLSDGRNGLRGTIHVDVREPSLSSSRGLGQGEEALNSISENSCNSCLDFISSDETLDRYDEIISASGWDLASYQRNPVFQNAHQYGDIIFTLGKALITEIRTHQPSTLNSQPSTFLFQRVQFATDVNPMAKIAYGLYRGKFLNAVSVGFIPIRWQNGDGTEHQSGRSLLPAPHSLSSSGGEGQGEEALSLRTPNSELRIQQPRRRYLEQELLEVSAVAIPANPNALALGLKSGAVEKSDLRDLADLIAHALDHREASWTAAPARSADAALASHVPVSNDQRLMRFARTLRDLLKHL